ncbi:MAG: hypothetical protein ACT4O0_13265 [Pseudonocardia sp.]
MTVKIRVAIYAGLLALALLLGGGYYLLQARATERPAEPSGIAGAVGSAVPRDDPEPAPGPESSPTHPTAESPQPLSSVAGGYRVVSETTSFTASPSQPFRFQLVGPDGQPVRLSATDPDDLALSLVVIRRDGTAFQHAEPVQDRTGTWTTSLNLPAGGSYAAWISFTPPHGHELRLGLDLAVTGEFTPQPAPSPTMRSDVDGYRVELAGTPIVGADSELTLTVARDGTPVTDLQLAEGGFAHLAIIRAGDLAYVDAHPTAASTDPAEPLRFTVHLPSPGTYWLFVKFRHRDQSHTAALSVAVPAAAGSAAPTPTPGNP